MKQMSMLHSFTALSVLAAAVMGPVFCAEGDAPTEVQAAPDKKEIKEPAAADAAVQRELQALRSEIELLRKKQLGLTEALAAKGNDAARAKLAEDPTLPAEKLISDQVVQRLLRSPDHELARTGMLFIRKNPTPDRVEALMDFARDTGAHMHLRYAAVDQLGALATPETLEVLLALVEDKDEGMIARSAGALGRTENRAYLPTLLKRLTGQDWKEAKDRSSEARRALVLALGQLKDKNATPVVLNVLQSPHEETVRYACVALRHLKDPSSVPVLLELAAKRKLATGHNYNRLDEELVRTLGSLKDKRAGKLFIDCLRSPEYKLREHAVRYLEAVCGADAFGELANALKGEWAAARAGEKRHNQLSGLVKALAATGRPDAVPILLEPLTEGMDGSLARDTATLLRQIAQPEHGAALVAAYPNINDKSARAEIARLLNEGKFPVTWDEKKKVFSLKPPAPKPAQPAPQDQAKKAQEKKDAEKKAAAEKPKPAAKQAAEKPPAAPTQDGEQF